MAAFDSELLPVSDRPLASWLVQSGLDGLPVEQLIDGFCTRLNDAGVRIGRAFVGTATLHPLVRAYGLTWTDGQKPVESQAMPHREPGEEPQNWLESPFHYMLNNDLDEMRRPLVGPQAKRDFPVLEEFAAAGYTDWVAFAHSFGWDLSNSVLEDRQAGIGMICSLASVHPGGFLPAEIDRLRRLVALLALAIKSTVLAQLARDITASYIGSDAASHVLSGEIRRGMAQKIDAIILWADLRGFTGVADRLAIEPLIETLNGYFDCLGPAIETQGGQVLKFLGDGLLASFQLASGQDPAPVCCAALKAAEDALAAIKLLNAERIRTGLPVLDLDIALHRGTVMYGNVGTGARLDFTLIGPAVNEVSRLEHLCGVLDRNLLASRSFAEAAGEAVMSRLVSLGLHNLRGVAEPQEVFGLSV
ncbi:MAG TPA: adenylate/guanylate cyclase domain-containing protein [Ferrovibrio sp.]|uniref:adenylate/guanylate cyclase domain-containing protein n=1 Tax=Ferrovibrio sp. TaxID=1917215 RepID=UPI002ED256AD